MSSWREEAEKNAQAYLNVLEFGEVFLEQTGRPNQMVFPAASVNTYAISLIVRNRTDPTIRPWIGCLVTVEAVDTKVQLGYYAFLLNAVEPPAHIEVTNPAQAQTLHSSVISMIQGAVPVQGWESQFEDLDTIKSLLALDRI